MKLLPPYGSSLVLGNLANILLLVHLERCILHVTTSVHVW